MKNCITINQLLLILLLGLIIPGSAIPSTCMVDITSIPDESRVSIDGRYQGTTPLKLGVSCSNHTIIIEKSGFVPYQAIIMPDPAATTTVTANMVYNPDLGSVLIHSYPGGASVYIDSIPHGTTPALVNNLPAGRHQILLKKEGYLDYTGVISAEPGTVLAYDEYLVPNLRTGFVSISSFPDDAAIWLDGERYGSTPSLPIRVPTGNHTLLLMKTGYLNYSAEIVVPGGDTIRIEATLTKIPDTGTLIIDSVPPGASVLLNGTYKAFTPAVLENIPAGHYELALTKQGHRDLNGTFFLAGGDTHELVAYLTNSSEKPGMFSSRVYGKDTNVSPPRRGLPDTVPSIDRTFTWYASGHEATVQLQIPEDLYKYYKQLNHRPESQGAYREYAITERDRAYLHDLIGLLKDAGNNRQLSSRRDYHNAVAFVQSITYELDSDYNGNEEYWKYPIETLADGRGDCEDTAILTAAILKEMDYDVALVLLPDHAAVAVACDTCNGYYYPLNGKRYYYLETTGAGYSLGMIGDQYKTAAAEVIPI